MTHVPEIAPEIRGLIEEIVADPRSALRLVPQRALRSWFETGAPVRPREVAQTRAERHLVAAHREALAKLLWEASQIAYFKTPRMAHMPTGPDGTSYHPADREPEWRARVGLMLGRSRHDDGGVGLLRACLLDVPAGLAWSLARAALALVRSDLNRLNVAFTVPMDQPRTAIDLYLRISRRASRTHQHQAQLSLGARYCTLALFADARRHYREAAAFDCGRIAGMNAFHLSCVTSEEQEALQDAGSLRDVAADDPTLVEAIALLRRWNTDRPIAEVARTTEFVRRLSNRVPEAARGICEGVYA